MSRYFMVQSWVGSHENEPDYNGNQCGERNVRSSEVAPLYDQYGNANIKAFSDEALRKKVQAKPKLSAFDKVCTADRSYEKLCTLSEELDQQLDSKQIDWDDYIYARKQLDKKLERAWGAVCRNRGWEGQEELLEYEQYPSEGLELTLDFEAKTQRQYDYSVIPSNSVFAELQDGNIFKQCAVFLLTACKWLAKLSATGKQLVQEGLV